MRESRVASRYAKSLLDLALEQGVLEKAKEDMKLILDTCRSNKDFSLFLTNPIIKTDKKIAVIKKVFAGKLTPMTDAFLDIITRKKREDLIEAIAYAFIEQYKIHKKILTAVITTASGLDDVLRKKVIALVKKDNQSEVELIEKTDKDLIGGFILKIGDKQLDESLSGKLKLLRRNFSENPYIKEI